MMRVHNVHFRELPTPAERVGALLDSLATEDDRLWPTERWPTEKLELDRPLAVGAKGGHGSIRYAVEQYEPGWSVLFRFTPGHGLRGTHGLDVEPLPGDRAILRHTLDARVEGRMIPLWPLVRRVHDVIVEDLLDNAELRVTGVRPRPVRRPLWMRAGAALMERRARAESGRSVGKGAVRAGMLTGGALAAIASLHAYWALGGNWPGSDRQSLAETVVGGPGTDFPATPLVWLVTALLATAAGTVAAAASGRRGRVARLGAGVAGAVLILRGVGGMASSLADGMSSRYAELDVLIYSPLCMALGCGALLAAWTGALRAKSAIASTNRSGSSVMGT